MHRISVEFRPILNKIAISEPGKNTSRGLDENGLRDTVPESATDEITVYIIFSLSLLVVT